MLVPPTDAAFDEFWKTYPRRVAKEAARKAFARVIKGVVTADTLIAGAKRYAQERRARIAADPAQEQFTKHPATWLNGGCWEDEAPPRPGGPPTLDGVTGEEVPTPRPRGNGHGKKTWADYGAELLARLEARDGH